ncbi:hypothetical protein ACFV30_01230 [Streptomyces sp. NPDC059752]|uniref:hypothetical protein n=1 Tax=unclassified Streptomyces TaxID=2593676 RepID=UPI00365F70D2
MPYDPSDLPRDAAQAIGRLVEDVASGKAAYKDPRDVARAFKHLQRLAHDLPQTLLQASSAIDRMARDRDDATELARIIGEAATSAASLDDQLRRAYETAQQIRAI